MYVLFYSTTIVKNLYMGLTPANEMCRLIWLIRRQIMQGCEVSSKSITHPH